MCLHLPTYLFYLLFYSAHACTSSALPYAVCQSLFSIVFYNKCSFLTLKYENQRRCIFQNNSYHPCSPGRGAVFTTITIQIFHLQHTLRVKVKRSFENFPPASRTEQSCINDQSKEAAQNFSFFLLSFSSFSSFFLFPSSFFFLVLSTYYSITHICPSSFAVCRKGSLVFRTL
jgi:hypothetical protein